MFISQYLNSDEQPCAQDEWLIRLQALHGQWFVIHWACRHWSLGQIMGMFLQSWTTWENDIKTFLHLSRIKKELGYKRKDFDPQLRLLLIYRSRKDDWLSWPEEFWVNRSRLLELEKFHRRDLNMRSTYPEGGTLSTQPLSHSATAFQECYEFHVPNKLLTSSQ